MEDFVTFEIAKKLREKGFREECIAYYHTDGELLYNRDQYRGGNYKSLLRSYNSLPKNPIGCEQIDAPTIYQVMKWLFDKKQLFVNISCNLCDEFGLFFAIYKKGEETWEACGLDDNYYNKPEEAALAGIEYVLDLDNLI